MNADIRRQYKNAAHLVNDKLKKLGEKLGLTVPLTSYVARHGWASIARSRNIPLAIISEAMGHDSEKTTRIYLRLFGHHLRGQGEQPNSESPVNIKGAYFGNQSSKISFKRYIS